VTIWSKVPARKERLQFINDSVKAFYKLRYPVDISIILTALH